MRPLAADPRLPGNLRRALARVRLDDALDGLPRRVLCHAPILGIRLARVKGLLQYLLLTASRAFPILVASLTESVSMLLALAGIVMVAAWVAFSALLVGDL